METPIPTTKSHIPKVVYIGISFTMLFTAYNAAQNLVSEIYKQLGFTNLGQICVFTIYCFLGLGSIFASHIKRKLSHKAGLLMGAIGYCSIVLMGTFTSFCYPDKFATPSFVLCQRNSIFALNIGSAVLVGLGASILWLTQSDYVNNCATEQTKGLANGIFWSLMQMSQILGSVLATLVLSKYDALTLYYILSVFGVVSIGLFSFIPRIENDDASSTAQVEELEPLSKSVGKFFQALRNRDSLFMTTAMILIGISIAFYASYLSVLNGVTLAANADTTETNKKMGYILIALAVGEVLAGTTVGRLADKMDKVQLLHLVIMIPEAALIVALIANAFTSYYLVIVCAFLWGYSDTALNTMMTSMIGAYFGGSLELFSIMRSLTGFGVVFGSAIAIFVGKNVVIYCAIVGAGIAFLHMVFLATRINPAQSAKSIEGGINNTSVDYRSLV